MQNILKIIVILVGYKKAHLRRRYASRTIFVVFSAQ